MKKREWFLYILLGLFLLWRGSEMALLLFSLDFGQKGAEWLLALMVLFIGYVLPIGGGIFFFWKKISPSYSKKWIILSIIGGCLLIGHLAGLLNYYLGTLLMSTFSNLSNLKEWIPSIVPPFVEESLKGAVACLMLFVLSKPTAKHAFLIGAGTGLGFQISEDFVYVIAGFFEKSSPLHEAFLRFETAFSSHWLLTGLFMLGIYSIRYFPKKWQGWTWLFLPFLLHVLWNSPFIDGNIVLKISLTLISWGILYLTWREISQETYL